MHLGRSSRWCACAERARPQRCSAGAAEVGAAVLPGSALAVVAVIAAAAYAAPDMVAEQLRVMAKTSAASEAAVVKGADADEVRLPLGRAAAAALWRETAVLRPFPWGANPRRVSS
jgi:hypothetical protein